MEAYLATVDGDGELCSVPVIYIVKVNHDICDNMVDFNVVANIKVTPNKFGELWESIYISGKADFVDDKKEKLESLKSYFKNYSPPLFNSI